jgi:hypothetical protein
LWEASDLDHVRIVGYTSITFVIVDACGPYRTVRRRIASGGLSPDNYHCR